MKHIEWHHELSTGIDAIDDDHKKLIDLTNRLIDAVTHATERTVFLSLYDELEAYTKYHFSREESYMTNRCHTFTRETIDNHIEQHRYFIDKLAEFKEQLRESDHASDPKRFEIVEFLVEWLLDHIIHEDLSLHDCVQRDIPKRPTFTAWLNKRFSLMTRARMIIVLPLALLFLATSYISYDLYRQYTDYTRIENISKSVLLIYNVINELQIERGLSSAYLTSGNASFKTLLLKQHRRTDQAVAQGLAFKATIGRYAVTRKAEKIYQKLRHIRRNVLSETLSRQESNRYYTRFIRALIEMIKSINYLSSQGIHRNSYLTLMMLIEMNENAGLIRNEGTYLITHPHSENDVFKTLYDTQLTYNRLFSHIAEPDILKRFRESKRDKDVIRFENHLKPMVYTPESSLPDASSWFKISSNYIDVYKRMIESILSDMYKNARTNKEYALWFFSLLWLALVTTFVATVFVSRSLKQSIVQPIAEMTRALQRLAKGDKSYVYTASAKDKTFKEMIEAFNTLRKSLIKADYIDTLVAIQSLKTRNFERLAEQDPLTGIANRRSFESAFEEMFRRATQQDKSLSLCILDLDHFKRINDTYGHETGDIVLKRFARQIQRHLRQHDLIARYGGEEFVVLLPDTSFHDACIVARKLKEAAAAVTFDDIHLALHVTVSIGVASTEEKEVTGIHHLFKLADARLYQAKNEGRNRIFPRQCAAS